MRKIFDLESCFSDNAKNRYLWLRLQIRYLWFETILSSCHISVVIKSGRFHRFLILGSFAQKFGAKNVESLVVWLDICTVDAVAASVVVLDTDVDVNVGASPTTGWKFPDSRESEWERAEREWECERESESLYGSRTVSFTEGGWCYVWYFLFSLLGGNTDVTFYR